MKSPIIATIALFIAFGSLSAQNNPGDLLSNNTQFSAFEHGDQDMFNVNSDLPKYLNSNIVAFPGGHKVGNGICDINGGEVVGIISGSSGGNGSGNLASFHRGGNG